MIITIETIEVVFGDKIDMQIKSERYFFGNINDGDNTYYFLDLDARYNKKTVHFPSHSW